MSPAQSVIVRNGRPEAREHGLGGARRTLVLLIGFSGAVMETSSTFENWCIRIMPRVASGTRLERKHRRPCG